jgi:hypothetical protein
MSRPRSTWTGGGPGGAARVFQRCREAKPLRRRKLTGPFEKAWELSVRPSNPRKTLLDLAAA